MLSIQRIIQRDWLIDIFFLAVAFLIFYTAWLGSYPLFTPDEGRYSEAAREMVVTHDYITPRINGVVFLDKPILYYWLQAVAIQLFGVKEWALRLFPALFGVLGCLITYFCGRLLFDRKSAMLAAIILATTPLYFSCAHYANLDLEVAVLISCALLFFITGLQRNQRSYLLTAYIFSAAAVLTKGLIGIILPLIIVGSWSLCRWDGSQLKKMQLPLGIILIAFLVLPWFWLVQQANPSFLHYFFVTQHFTRYLSGAVFNNQAPFWFYIPIILLGFFPWSIFLLQSLIQNIKRVVTAPRAHPIELFLLLWVGTVFIFFFLAPL